MMILFTIITIAYVIIISVLYIAYGNVIPFNHHSENFVSRFSIIIPFRNEASHLNELLQSIKTINYPKSQFEIILVDDDSEDNSVEIIQSFKTKNKKLSIQILKNKKGSFSPKKDAIEIAISHSTFEWIITTDADCVVSEFWLKSFNSLIQKKSPKLIVAPVGYRVSKSILDNFQWHNFLSLQTATVGGFGIGNPFLCNGANLCYSKHLFNELSGFDGHKNIASGDDVLFMEHVVKSFPKSVYYLKAKSAIVYTKPVTTLTSLINQQVRWASKTTAYQNVFSKVLALVVLLMNSILVVSLLLSILGLQSWVFFSIIFIIKFLMDFFFILRSSYFYNQNSSLIYYPINSILYPFFAIYVSCFSLFFKYKWKERYFNI